MTQKLIKIAGKPYFFYKLVSNIEQIHKIKQQFPKIRYYYMKTYNPRTKHQGYAVYLDRKIWY